MPTVSKVQPSVITWNDLKQIAVKNCPQMPGEVKTLAQGRIAVASEPTEYEVLALKSDSLNHNNHLLVVQKSLFPGSMKFNSQLEYIDYGDKPMRSLLFSINTSEIRTTQEWKNQRFFTNCEKEKEIPSDIDLNNNKEVSLPGLVSRSYQTALQILKDLKDRTFFNEEGLEAFRTAIVSWQSK